MRIPRSNKICSSRSTVHFGDSKKNNITTVQSSRYFIEYFWCNAIISVQTTVPSKPVSEHDTEH